ncbi:MAG: type I-E CRISPR-associated protein Cas6/Cse3/CasE [Hyphomicrobiales bacterium]|nr:type I-E CRISPR-associated protein Cas6/Cse3/CasE [Hyphomicrobiales bacterium]
MSAGLYLSRATLRRDAATAALVALLDPDDPSRALDAHHRLIWSLFADGPDRRRDYLWRTEAKGRFLLLSRRLPQDDKKLFEIETKPFEPNLSVGDRLGFVLRANAVVDRPSAVLKADPVTRRPRDRRVDVVMHRLHKLRARDAASGDPGERAAERGRIASEEGRAWLVRQGESRGFEVVRAHAEGYRRVSLPRKGKTGGGAVFGVLDLAGVVAVRQPETFVSALARGLGKAKAFGCGLMLVRRA